SPSPQWLAWNRRTQRLDRTGPDRTLPSLVLSRVLRKESDQWVEDEKKG
ncbi:14943_t:CDS:1, partial [Dentiscutata erythropus]